MLDYESLKVMAKSMGRSVKDLLALSIGADPFYAGVGYRAREAEWFAGIWSEYGVAGSHLRRLHYQLVSSGKRILLPNGREYQNTLDDWGTLLSASLAARYLGLIPSDGLVDRRNDEPMIFATNLDADPDQERRASCELYYAEPDVDLPDMPSLPTLDVDGLESSAAVQKFIVEIWIEKSTQNDWLVPLCERRGVNLVVGIGEQSEIRSRELAMRSAKYGAPVRVIYISDFDPAGRSMPKAMARKVEFTIAKFNLDLDIQLIPLALTPEQCTHYRLPRTPIKDTEKRKEKFEQSFGVGATELDAMEALHPGELGRLLEAEIDNYLDAGLRRRIGSIYSDQRLKLRRIEERIRAKHAHAIEEVTERFDEIVVQLQEWQDLVADLWETMSDELAAEQPDLSDVAVPRSEALGKTERFILFDSRRDYFTQMDAYNAWREGDES